MTQLLQDKSLATKFQILVEIAVSQPYVRQKSIAKSVSISPQAVSQYIKYMVKDGWVHSDGRSNHCVTKEGVDWLLKALREVDEYLNRVDQITRNISVCAAVASCDLAKGQQVGLVMKDGVLIANSYDKQRAKGIAATAAKAGEDIGISSIEGIVELATGEVVILSVPGIKRGGSKKANLSRLREEIVNGKVVGAIGIEAVVTLKQIGITPQYTHGVTEAAIEAAQRGLSIVIVCVNNEVPLLMQRLDDKRIEYRVLEMERSG
jgi:putative transcriptional regulator